MNSPANRKPSNRRLEVLPKPVNAERLAQAREYAKQFTFDTLSEEDLLRIRRSAYAYLL